LTRSSRSEVRCGAGEIAAMAEVWTTWEGEAINGVFPLRRLLGGSDRSGVFLTEYRAQNLPNAAIKIVPADPAPAEAQLSRWRMAATLSHPHLIRLLDAGRCQRGDHRFLFVVMEYAEETLSQILPCRALTADEVREMLLPTLDALAFLHRKNLVQGQLKPPNFLVVNDQLKLASDTVRRAGESMTRLAHTSLYDPPEAKDDRICAAGDIWALGITMVEALTQRPPEWPDERSETASLPTSLPPAFVEIVRRCLSRNPASRPTAADLQAQLKRGLQAPVVSTPQPVARKAIGRTIPPPVSPKRRSFVPPIAVLLIILAAVWAALRLFQGNPTPRPLASSSQTASQQAAAPAATASQNPEAFTSASPEVSAPSSSTQSAQSGPAPPRPVLRPSEQPAHPPANASLSVLHEEIPDVPRKASDTIHGHFNVAVRVTVDSSGNVVGETLENPGPSKYFARLGTAAARKWKFAPADNQDSREWLVSFEFTRGGATGHATAPRY
jgi:serine/threonine protein kinase